MTKIFKDYAAFLQREDKTINGVDQYFSDRHPHWEQMNETNRGCWNCYDCSDCSRCSGCSGCYDCSDCSGCSRCSRCSDCSRCSGCYDCYDCSDCSGCSRCSGCYDCYGEKRTLPAVPVINNIHAAVYDAASQPKALNMSEWHTCETTHCRAGWVVYLASEQGKALEKETSTLFAAMQIYKASSPIHVPPTRFFDDNKSALENMKECAEQEQQNN